MIRYGGVLGLVALAWALSGSAHQDGQDQEEAVFTMDCQHPPSNAVRKLPEPLAKWGRISCFPSGQALTQSSDAQWRYPASWTDKVLIPARTASDEVDGKPRYFTHIQVRKMEDKEGRAKHQELLKQVTVYADRISDPNTQQTPDTPKAAWELTGTNNQNHDLKLYLMQHDGRQELWGLVCAPRCESHLAFIVTPYD